MRQRPAKPCTRVRFPSPPPDLIPPARLAQRESASLTRKRSLVQSQYRAPQYFMVRGGLCARISTVRAICGLKAQGRRATTRGTHPHRPLMRPPSSDDRRASATPPGYVRIRLRSSPGSTARRPPRRGRRAPKPPRKHHNRVGRRGVNCRSAAPWLRSTHATAKQSTRELRIIAAVLRTIRDMGGPAATTNPRHSAVS